MIYSVIIFYRVFDNLLTIIKCFNSILLCVTCKVNSFHKYLDSSHNFNMKYLFAFVSAFLIFKSSFISSNIIPPRNLASKKILKEKLGTNIFNNADTTINTSVKKILKEQLKGSLSGLEHVDFSNMFAKRPQGGNDDPTVMLY